MGETERERDNGGTNGHENHLSEEEGIFGTRCDSNVRGQYAIKRISRRNNGDLDEKQWSCVPLQSWKPKSISF